MSEQFKKFQEMVKSDSELQAKLKHVKTHDEFVNTCIKLAKEKGIDLTEKDVNASVASQKKGELSAEDLEGIAGGNTGTTCSIFHHC